jgi:hypothetical protein
MPLSTINSNSFSTTANTNIDNGLLFLDVINNRVGVGTTTPTYALNVKGPSSDYRTALFETASTNGPSVQIKGSKIYELRSTDSGAGEGAGNFFIYDKDNEQIRLKIDSSGRITKPAQPSFAARWVGTGKDGSTISPVQFNTTSINVGNCFNTSTYRFTAPIAGVYSFTSQPGYKETNSDFSWGFAINGSRYSDNVRVLGSTPNTHSAWTGSLIINLAANDTVEVQFSAGTYHQNAGGFNYFSGILIG